MSQAVAVEPHFLAGTAGRLFAVHFKHHTPARAAVLVLPPIAEEMNKARPMLAEQARALARAGLDVLLPDLHGTGDSEGEFGEATFEQWGRDLRTAHAWLAQLGYPKIHLWAVRGGALMLASLVDLAGPDTELLLWQPVLNGRQMVTQLLRLRVAAEAARGSVQTTDGLRKVMREAGRLEIAGYEFSRALIESIEAQALDAAVLSAWSRVTWLDVIASPSTEPLPASARVLEPLRAKGASVQHENVVGEPFWGTPEIARISALIAGTQKLFASEPLRVAS